MCANNFKVKFCVKVLCEISLFTLIGNDIPFAQWSASSQNNISSGIHKLILLWHMAVTLQLAVPLFEKSIGNRNAHSTFVVYTVTIICPFGNMSDEQYSNFELKKEEDEKVGLVATTTVAVNSMLKHS